jgi:phenylacetate-CoA ligase
MQLYKFYSDSQWWSKEQLIEYQTQKLKETITIAYRDVKFYKELYDLHKIKVHELDTVEDLSRLPIITKAELKEAYPDKCTRKTNMPWKEYFTSGSSGRPFAVRVDNLTMSHARALMFIRASFSGWEIGMPLLQTGITPIRGMLKSLKDFFLNVDYASAFDLTNDALDRSLEIISKKNLKYVMGFPGSIYYMAVRAEEIRFNHKLDGIVTWGDNLYRHYRQKIETVFGCKITDTYGCGEGIQVAAQCGYSNGAYHIFMPHVVVEVVDDDGFPVKRGEPGNIVLTRLDAGAMPLIRYNIGDVSRLHTEEKCSCGRGLKMLYSIDGRDTDAIISPNGNRLIVHFFTGIFEYYPSIENFFIFQDKSGAIMVEIVPRSDFRIGHWHNIKREILEKGDADLQLEMKLVRETSNISPNSKRRFVLSEYSKESTTDRLLIA